MEYSFMTYLEALAVEYTRIFAREYTAHSLRYEITSNQLHGIETTVICALLLELKTSLQKGEIK